jgi:hypothetical protein
MKPVRKVRGFWEPHEIEILRQVYPTGGPEAVKEKLPHRNLSAIAEKCHQLAIYINEETTARRRAEAAARTMNMKKAQEGDITPPEYLQAADIFQVGYRIARDMGVVHEYA